MNNIKKNALEKIKFRRLFRRTLSLLLPVMASLIAGSILILLTGKNPLTTFVNLFDTGFTCRTGSGRCALLTALQFATPLVFSGLSVVVALRAGFFSIGQAGQMLFGAATASAIGARLSLNGVLHPAISLMGAAVSGALWALVPVLLRETIGVNEVIATLLLNPIASVLVGVFRPGRIIASSKLLPLVAGTKVTLAIFLAVAAAAAIFVLLWRTGKGLEIRNSAQAPRFALYGGIKSHSPVIYAMLVSGALAGLAGAVEVLGVQYRFVSTFSAVNDFDGLIVAFAGQLHPVGVLLLSFLLGGLRSGAIVGLQIRSGIPRELGGALIAMLLIFAATHRFSRRNNRKDLNKEKTQSSD